MSKRSFVCFKCHSTKRADAAFGLHTNYRCPICQGGLVELPWNWRIPKGDDDDGWQQLEAMLMNLNAEWIPGQRIYAQEELSRIERQIERLMQQKPTQLRDKKLAKLHWQKQHIEELYSEYLPAHDVTSDVD